MIAEDLTPKQIVAELDQHIVGQDRAKRLVAIALRSRWRRMRIPQREAREVLPKHILMIGPTGCGKTEIARRLARLHDAPFVKVEATKFTEVGYVGRDVDSIVRDLVAASLRLLRRQEEDRNRENAEQAAEERLLAVLVGNDASQSTRDKYSSVLNSGDIESKEIEIELSEKRTGNLGLEVPGMSANVLDLSDMVNNAMGMGAKKKVRRSTTVAEARKALIEEEQDKRIDMQQLGAQAIKRAEQRGLVFLDEIDKILESGESGGIMRGGVSREGVQRDLLPLIEGTTVQTRHGMVDTRHILFIAAGAFHLAKPSDLIPELQGRLPVRVELDSLTTEDYFRILQEPRYSLIKQYQALFAVEGVELTFETEALRQIAEFAHKLNLQHGNVGARRLFTVMERLLESLSFSADELPGAEIIITAKEVKDKLSELENASTESLVIL